MKWLSPLYLQIQYSDESRSPFYLFTAFVAEEFQFHLSTWKMGYRSYISSSAHAHGWVNEFLTSPFFFDVCFPLIGEISFLFDRRFASNLLTLYSLTRNVVTQRGVSSSTISPPGLRRDAFTFLLLLFLRHVESRKEKKSC